MRFSTLILLVIFGISAPLLAQSARAERQDIEGRAKKLDPDERERRQREWMGIVDGMTAEDRAAFRKLSPEGKRQRIALLAERARQVDETTFLESLPVPERDAILALPTSDRSVRILELKLRRQLTRVLEVATKRELLTEDEAAAKASERSPRIVAETVLDLQKRIFLDVHAAELQKMLSAKREAIIAMAPQQFFKSPLATELRVRGVFLPRARQELKTRPREVALKLLAEIERGEISQEFHPWFRAGAIKDLGAMSPEERNRIARFLRNTLFARTLETQEPGSAQEKTPRPNLWEFVERLSPEDRRAFQKRTGSVERYEFLRQRFPAELPERSAESLRKDGK